MSKQVNLPGKRSKMPVSKHRKNDGRIETRWTPEGTPKTHEMNLKEGRGEKSTAENNQTQLRNVIQRAVTRLATNSKNSDDSDGKDLETPSQIAKYLFDEYLKDQRINPITVLNRLKIKNQTIIKDIKAYLLYYQMRNEHNRITTDKNE